MQIVRYFCEDTKIFLTKRHFLILLFLFVVVRRV